MIFADESFFTMFTFPFLSGSPEKALKSDNAIVLTESSAARYFGEENPVGKTMTITFGEQTKDCIVTGLAKEVPSNSTLQFDMVMHISNIPVVRGDSEALKRWGDSNTIVYFKMREGNSVEQVVKKFPHFYDQTMGFLSDEYRSRGTWTGSGHPYILGVQSMKDIRLDPVYGGSGMSHHYILYGIGLMILLIACINYVNLSIAMASSRSMEVGLLKVMGAGRKHFVGQFLLESIVTGLSALLVGILGSILLLPQFNDLTRKSIDIGTLFSIQNILIFLTIAILTGLISGIYPAMVMSGLKPVRILQKRMQSGGRKIFVKSLVITQFVFSICLLSAATVMSRQLDFMINKYAGYNATGLISVPLPGDNETDRIRYLNRIRDRLQSNPNVLGISGCTTTFGRGVASNGITVNDRKIFVYKYKIDETFIPTMDFQLVEGRNFSKLHSTDAHGVIVNQTLCRELGLVSPIGCTIGDPSKGFPYRLTIIGVVKDFHYRSLHYDIHPLILHMYPDPQYDRIFRMVVRITPERIQETLNTL